MYEIDSPDEYQEREIPKYKASEYPFAQMDVGDSFFAPDESFERRRFNAMCYRSAKKLGIKLSVIKVVDGVRVRRIK